MLIRTILPASDDEARANLRRAITDRCEDYTGLSRLIGRPPSFLGRYVREGVPRALGDGERTILARYFGVSVETFGGVTPHAEPKPAYKKPELRAR